ncbi:MAG: RNA methyltransferase [Chloroflexi bacterium]|nr:RNA methyltransferase [Chloroflexota bacterium]
MPSLMITSSENNRVKQVRALLTQAKQRRQEQQCVLEGVRLIEDALLARVQPDFVLYRPDADLRISAAAEILNRLQAQNIPCLVVEPTIFNKLSDTQNPQGILAVCPLPELAPRQPLSLVLILDGIADPGNLGSALRTAGAVGVDLVILSPDTVDPFNPKVLRGGMGAHFRLPIQQQTWAEIGQLGLPLVIADADGERHIFEMDWTTPVALVVGNEAHGPSQNARVIASQVIRIPMVSAESLNAAMAASVILYEIFRQRHYA